MRQNKVKVAFTIDPATYEQLKMAFDERHRSAFVNQEISSELKRNSILKMQKMIDEIKPVKSQKTAAEMVKDLRLGREDYLAQRHLTKKPRLRSNSPTGSKK